MRFLKQPAGKTKAYIWCLFAYILALGTAVFTGFLFQQHHPIIIAFTGCIAATIVIYIFGRVFNNSSFFDPYWSVAPVMIALYWIISSTANDVNLIRLVTVFVLVLIWGTRLTCNWATLWQGLGHEDWRYTNLRNKTGKWYWLVDLAGIEFMPMLVVFLGCLTLYPVIALGNNPIGLLDIIALVATSAAILIESVADGQLRSFMHKRAPGEIMNQGLWAYSRHPNYFGEILFWWGLWIFALSSTPGYWWTIIGPLSVTLLFVSISIPLIERRHIEKRPGYIEHQEKVSALIPWFRRS